MSRKAIARISKNGQVTIEVDGVEGTSCTELTRGLVSAVGEEEEVVEKEEAYAQELPDYIEQFSDE